MKILVLGDSITKGIIYDDIKQRYSPTANSFVKMLQNDNVDIENISLMGSTVQKGMSTLERMADEVKNYDYTVIEFGGNDCDYNWAEIAENPYISHNCKTPLKLFKDCYTDIVRKIRELGSEPVILSLPPIDSQKYFSWISKGLDGSRIVEYLGDVEHIARWQRMYNVAVNKIAKTEHVELLDITTPFLETCSFKHLYCTDGIHPNEDGHKLIYETLSNIIKRKHYA